MKKFKAFTLVELMIALTVIGILSALVLPMLSNNSPNRNKMMMKKAYYTITDVVNELVNDTALYPEIDSSGNEYVGFDNLQSACEAGGCSGLGKFPSLFPKQLNIDGDITYGGSENSYSYFTTNDGMSWVVHSEKMTGHNIPTEISDVETGDPQIVQSITVDVNGNKKPNCQQGDGGDCEGRTDGFDKFTVYVSQSGKIIPMSGQDWFIEAIGVGSDLNGD